MICRVLAQQQGKKIYIASRFFHYMFTLLKAQTHLIIFFFAMTVHQRCPLRHQQKLRRPGQALHRLRAQPSHLHKGMF